MIRIKILKDRIVIMVLLLISVISLTVTIYTISSKNSKEILVPDYAEIEENAEPFGDQAVEKYEQPEQGGGMVDIIYEKDVEVDLSENKLYLLYGNPKVSNHDMLVQIIIRDMLIAESGMIQSGNRVTELSIKDDAKSSLISGQYDGEIRVYFYDCISGKRAQVDVKIPVLITVKE